TDVDPVCIDASSFQLQASPAGGTWSGDVDANGNFNPANGSGSATYTYKDGNGCENSDTVQITVNPLPEVSITDVDPVCIDASSFQLQASPAGGTWSGDVDANGNFNPANGSGSATYTYKDGNGCENSDTVQITVNPLPEVSITDVDPVCIDASSFQLQASPAGGTWSGDVDANGNFNPANGSGSATYTYEDGNGCENSDTVQITVNPLPTITPQTPVCSEDLLTYSVAFSSNGTVTVKEDIQGIVVANGSVSGIPAGQNITLVATSTDQCTAEAIITAPDCSCPVVEVPQASDQAECDSGQTLTASATAGNGEVIDWFDAQNNPVQDPSLSNVGMVTYFAQARNTTTNCTSAKIPVKLEIYALPDAPETTPLSYCIGETPDDIESSVTATGTLKWYSDENGINQLDGAPSIDTNSASVETYYVTQIDGNSCESLPTMIQVTVYPDPTIEIISKECSEDALTYSITFESNGEVESSAGEVDNENGIVSGIPSGESVLLMVVSENECEIQEEVEAEVCTDVQLDFSSFCFEDGAYLDYDVKLIGLPDVTSFTITWKDNDGATVDTDEIELENGMASGWIPWPGIVLDENDVVIDWPGWVLEDDVWVMGDDGFEDLRPTADIEVSFNSGNGGRFMGPNASLNNEEDGVMPQEFKVAYPPGTPQCNPNPPEEDPCVLYGGIADDLYQVKDHTREAENYKHSVWVNGFPCQGAKANFSFDDDMYKGYAYTLLSNGNFVITGTAVLSGIQNNNCEDDYEGSVWSVYFEFAPIEDISGVDPFSAHGFDDTGFPEDPIWDYYELVPGRGEMTLLEGDFEYDAITFTKMDNDYAFQVGDGANAKNSGLGAASWLNYTVWSDGQEAYSNSGAIHADINVNLHEIICEPVFEEDPICETYASFYAHNGPNNASSIIYGVEFENGNATFTELIDMAQYGANYRVHISFDEDMNILYTARNDGSELISFVYNPVSLKWQELNRIELDGVPGGIVQNTFFNDMVYLGSSVTNDIYSVNPLTAAVTHYDFTNLNINGGDLAVKDGRMFSASRSGRKIYLLDFDSLTGSVINNNQGTPAQVNGFGLSLGGNFVMTNDGANVVYVLDNNGAELGSYNVVADFDQLMDGDFAAGCVGRDEDPQDPCEDYKAFYADHNGGDTRLYGVSLDDNSLVADFDFITSLPYQAHITLNTTDGYVYAVDEDDNKIYKINPNGGTTEDVITLNATDGSSINSIYCMAFFEDKIYLGSAQKDQIYEVELDGDYSVIASEVPVQGGDLIFRNNRLYLATRAQNKLYFIAGGPDSEIHVGDIAGKVNGLALNASNEFITTNYGHNKVYRYDGNGGALAPYTVSGDLTTFKNGDLASGCTSADPEPLCDVATFDNPGAEGAQIAKDDPQNNDFNNGWHQYSANQEPSWLGWSTTTSIEVQETGRIDGNDSFCGNFHFELLSRAEGDNMYQVVTTQPNTTVYLSFYHKKRRQNNIVNVMDVLVGSESDFDPEDHSENTTYGLSVVETIVRTWEDGWEFVQIAIEPDSDSTVIMLRGQSGTTTSVGNLIDDVYIGCEMQEEREPCNGDDNNDVPPLTPHDGAYSDLMIDASRVSLYPVPAHRDLSIKIDNSGQKVTGTYYITSINGRTGHKGEIHVIDGESDIVKEDVSDLPDGMYFLMLEINGRVISKQFMKISN
ncbi:Ig-like domain-containing protein, partial [Winogradskyella aurantiaca]|uniref:Ig-like domain-containing protein n=1 Tax=Winogradskyella aurantiaca TaxID=2219558 RepID=UPI001300387D